MRVTRETMARRARCARRGSTRIKLLIRVRPVPRTLTRRLAAPPSRSVFAMLATRALREDLARPRCARRSTITTLHPLIHLSPLLPARLIVPLNQALARERFLPPRLPFHVPPDVRKDLCPTQITSMYSRADKRLVARRDIKLLPPTVSTNS